MKVKPRSNDNIARIANEIRKILNLSNSDYCDIVKILEHAVIQDGTEVNYIIVEENELPDEYAKFVPSENTLYIRQDVYDEASNGCGRHRFTIAHELAHVFLHGNEISFARMDESIPIYFDSEWQANTFARHLLCPIEGVGNLSSQEVAENFGVSKQVAEIQINIKTKKNYSAK